MCLPRERIMKLKGYIALADDRDRNLSYLSLVLIQRNRKQVFIWQMKRSNAE